MFLKKTKLREGYVATLQTKFLYLNDICIEIYYFFMGQSNRTTLTVKVKHEVGIINLNLNLGPLNQRSKQIVAQ